MTQRRHEAAYLLHAVPYRETSLVVDLFTRDSGRIAAVAKGAKRRTSALRGALLQFQPLSVSWSGRNELRTLTGAEWAGGQIAPSGAGLICAFYMNELLVRLLAREDPHPGLFDGYARALAALADGESTEQTLRRFEWHLLRESGYAPDLRRDAQAQPIQPDVRYRWRPAQGFLASEPAGAAPGAPGIDPVGPGWVDGRTLGDIAAERFDSPQSRMQAKYLTRTILAHHLDGAALNSRQILIDLQQL